jgi:hypothetical protein
MPAACDVRCESDILHSYTDAPVTSAAHSPAVNSRTQQQVAKAKNGDTSNSKRMLKASDTQLGWAWVVDERVSEQNSFKSFHTAR